MFKFLMIAVAFCFAAACAPAVALAAKAQVDRCAARPGDYRRQCFIEAGATCEPTTGRLWLRGPSGGTIRGVERLDACISQKRAQGRR
jgi:hypothetical protein